MKRIFINQEGKSNKYWSIAINEDEYKIEFGKIGTKGREVIKESKDKQLLYKEVEQLINEKLNKGYIELYDEHYFPEKIQKEYFPMDENGFWNIISFFNWKKTGDDDAVLRPALKKLILMKVDDIIKFADILAEKLYNLDGIEYASNIGPDSYKDDDSFFSTDYFLYIRCCVVANGKEYYYNVLNNPTKMPKEIEFEALLYLADDAYNLKMKTEENFIETKLSFETFSNKEAWALK